MYKSTQNPKYEYNVISVLCTHIQFHKMWDQYKHYSRMMPMKYLRHSVNIFTETLIFFDANSH